MKNKYILILTLTALILSSCGKDWLEVEPIARYTEEDKKKANEELGFDIEMIRATMDGAYLPLGYQQPWGTSAWVSLNSLADDANCGGGSAGDRKEFEELDEYKLTSTSLAPAAMFEKLYRGVQASNLLLSDASLYDSPALNVIKAEGKTLRAYYYFDLVRFFGDVPYITEITAISTRVPVNNVLDSLIADLEKSVPNLADKSADGKLNIAAGYTLLGKIYLWKKNYNEAAKCFAKVVSNSKFGLLDDYESVFDWQDEYNKEVIFTIPYDGTIGFDWNGWSRTSNMDVKLCGIRSLKFNDDADPLLMRDGWGFIKPTPNIVDTYIAENDMVRLNANIWYADKSLTQYAPHFEIALEDIASFTDVYQFEGFFRRKYSLWMAMPMNGDGFAEINQILYRYADILLLQAECILNGAADPNGNTADYYVNLVRERVDLPPKTNVTMADVKLERRLELAFEFERYFDLVRWGDAETVLGPRGFKAATAGLYPIPFDQILATGGELTQNPGY